MEERGSDFVPKNSPTLTEICKAVLACMFRIRIISARKFATWVLKVS
jgi:hypothetical protein